MVTLDVLSMYMCTYPMGAASGVINLQFESRFTFLFYCKPAWWIASKFSLFHLFWNIKACVITTFFNCLASWRKKISQTVKYINLVSSEAFHGDLNWFKQKNGFNQIKVMLYWLCSFQNGCLQEVKKRKKKHPRSNAPQGWILIYSF